MRATIGTDASFIPNLNIGVYAFQIVSNKGRIKIAGSFKEKVTHSHEAEFKAILNALYYLFYKLKWNEIDFIIINTDNITVLKIINGSQKFDWAKELSNLFNKYKKENKCRIQAKKVKAHSKIKDKRHYVNNWCDQNAKIKVREKINEEANKVINN